MTRGAGATRGLASLLVAQSGIGDGKVQVRRSVDELQNGALKDLGFSAGLQHLGRPSARSYSSTEQSTTPTSGADNGFLA